MLGAPVGILRGAEGGRSRLAPAGVQHRWLDLRLRLIEAGAQR